MTNASARRWLKRECAKLGATIEAEHAGIHYDIAIEAPAGHIWNGVGVHEVVSARFGAFDWEALVEDVQGGIAPCPNRPTCEWCDPDEAGE